MMALHILLLVRCILLLLDNKIVGMNTKDTQVTEMKHVKGALGANLETAMFPSTSSSVVSPVTSFIFPRSQCQRGSFADSENSRLIGNLTATTPSCENSNGVNEKTPFTSSKTVSMLQSTLSNNNFAVELWVRPALNLKQDLAIFSIVPAKTSTAGQYCNDVFGVILLISFFQ